LLPIQTIEVSRLRIRRGAIQILLIPRALWRTICVRNHGLAGRRPVRIASWRAGSLLISIWMLFLTLLPLLLPVIFRRTILRIRWKHH